MDADLVVLDGDPLSVYTLVLETWVEGQRVFDFSDEKDRLYALGGDGAGDAFRREPVLRRRPMSLATLALAALACPGSPALQDVLVVRGRTVHTVTGEPIENGVVVCRDGKIAAVGPASAVEIPEGATQLAAAVVTPGLVDAHSVVGLSGLAQPEPRPGPARALGGAAAGAARGGRLQPARGPRRVVAQLRRPRRSTPATRPAP